MKRLAAALLLWCSVGRADPIEDALRERGVSWESHEHAPGRKSVISRVAGGGGGRPLLVVASGRTAALALDVRGLLAERKPALARDVIFVWTDGGESAPGIRYALAEHRAAIDAELALVLGDGEPGLQVAEKLYQDYMVRAAGPGGAASAPPAANPIYRLSAGLDRLARHRFPARVLDVVRPGLAGRAEAFVPVKGRPSRAALAALDADPALAAQLRTTCVATQVHGGNREDTVPAEAYANVSCRLLPDESTSDVTRQLAAALGDAGLEVRAIPPMAGPAIYSPVGGPVVDAVRRAFGVPIDPGMAVAATEAGPLRGAGIAAYRLSLGKTPEILYRVILDIAKKY